MIDSITSIKARNPLLTQQFFEKLKKTMCSLRCLFVLSQSGEIMISKRFPTVEKRARLQESSLTPIPSDVEFSEAVRFLLTLSSSIRSRKTYHNKKTVQKIRALIVCNRAASQDIRFSSTVFTDIRVT